ncbi:MAG TPA: copper-binding protein [Noviherbaspirillum sp.]|uniref:copper-binding protein n=1 Tax=Noviherbaspirillum sp. TaxID=1926288 RepID=UPI002D65B08A|nr:copper-binding protein [Noviherbaspirillum sp.]HYD95987.1 copper-binding protein [Noviherbaspirillum sp.]
MKHLVSTTLALALSGIAFAQSGNKEGAGAHNHGPTNGKSAGQKQAAMSHEAEGTVKSIDAKKTRVTIAHGPVQSLKWPGMTMAFAVKDKSLFDKLTVGQKVQFEFVQQGANYVITSVR